MQSPLIDSQGVTLERLDSGDSPVLVDAILKMINPVKPTVASGGFDNKL
jgi:hypothetical protein